MATIKELEYYLSQARRIAEHREREAELGIRKTYKTVLEDIRSFLGNEYAKNAKDDKLTYADLQQKGQFARFLEGVEKIVNEGTPEVSKQIKSTVNEVYKACYDGMVNAVKKSSTTKELHDQLKGLKNTTPETIKRAVENPIAGLTLDDTLEKNRKEVIYDIKREIGVGLANGDRYTTMAKRLTERVDMDYRKAVTIVRTETHRVKEAGFHDGATDINETLDKGTTSKRLQKKWVSMRDERVRKTSKSNHRKMDGVSIPVDEMFDLGHGVKAESPGNSGDAANDIHCRCFLRYELVEVPEKAKKSIEAQNSDKDNNKYENITLEDAHKMQDAYDFDVYSKNFKEETGYFGGRYATPINRGLREGKMLQKFRDDKIDITPYVEKIDSYMRPIERNIKAYRNVNDMFNSGIYKDIVGVDNEIINKAIDGEDVTDKLKQAIGKTITDKGYLSTSYDLNKSVVSGVVGFEFNIPKGTKAIVSGNDKESEILIHRNASYTITDIEVVVDEDGFRTVKVYADIEEPTEVKKVSKKKPKDKTT